MSGVFLDQRDRHHRHHLEGLRGGVSGGGGPGLRQEAEVFTALLHRQEHFFVLGRSLVVQGRGRGRGRGGGRGSGDGCDLLADDFPQLLVQALVPIEQSVHLAGGCSNAIDVVVVVVMIIGLVEDHQTLVAAQEEGAAAGFQGERRRDRGRLRRTRLRVIDEEEIGEILG